MKNYLLIICGLFMLSCTKNIELSNAKVSTKTVALDVRSFEELSANPAPGAVHIPMSEISNDSLLPEDKNTPILVFCEAGGRAAAAKEVLIGKGYKSVKNIKDWRTWNKLQTQ